MINTVQYDGRIINNYISISFDICIPSIEHFIIISEHCGYIYWGICNNN